MVSEATPQEGADLTGGEWNDPLGIVDAIKAGWKPSYAEPTPPGKAPTPAPEQSTTAPEQPRQSPAPSFPAPSTVVNPLQQAQGEQAADAEEPDDAPDGQLTERQQAKLLERWGEYQAIAQAGLEPGKKSRWTEIPKWARYIVAASIGPNAIGSLQSDMGIANLRPMIDAATQYAVGEADQKARAEERQLAAYQQQQMAEYQNYANQLVEYFGDPEDFEEDSDFSSKALQYPAQAQDYLQLIRSMQPEAQAEQQLVTAQAQALHGVWTAMWNHPYMQPFGDLRAKYMPGPQTYSRYGQGPEGQAQGMLDFALEWGRRVGAMEAKQQYAAQVPQQQQMIERQLAAAGRNGLPRPDHIQDNGDTGGFKVPLELLQDSKKFAEWVSTHKDEFEAWERAETPGLKLAPLPRH